MEARQTNPISRLGGNTISDISQLFTNNTIIERIKMKLPELFQLAEIESSRAGKIGMEVGVLRERVLVALLIYKFGEANVKTEIPTTEPEVDVKVNNKPISIKTITGNLTGVKLIWTVDADKAKEFRDNYTPVCDIILAQIKWGAHGALYYLPIEAQKQLVHQLGRNKYIKLPKPGTNPRGVEITKDALTLLTQHKLSKNITINWQKTELDYSPIERWLDYWREE